MQIHFIRNATLILEMGGERILIDPMLGPKGSLPPYAFLRHKPSLNPTVHLPENAKEGLQSVTTGLITHCRLGHFDHLDKTGWRLLESLAVPVYCNQADEPYLQKRGLKTIALYSGDTYPLFNGTIHPVTATHGYGLVGKMMGAGLGYVLDLPGEPKVYISGDTVLTPTVMDTLTKAQPDIAICATGAASLDIGKPILMPIEESIEFIRLAPGHVIATHMESLNHCPVTRAQIQQAIRAEKLSDKVWIPQDGERRSF